MSSEINVSTCLGLNPCINRPCQNNGTCIIGSGGNYSCDCPSFYYGINCQTGKS